MKRKDVHVMPREKDGKWIVKVEHNQRASRVFDNQRLALEAGREMSMRRHSELVIHGRDGAIRDKRSYGNDPRSIKG